MALRNAFENLATESKQTDLIAAVVALQSALEITTVSVSNFPVTQAVTGPLTDTELRATPVPISDGGASVTVDGSVSVANFPVTQAVSLAVNTPDVTDRAARLLGHVTVDNFPSSQAVTGPLTDTQLRASDVGVSVANFPATQPVSATALPLPTGAATSAKQDLLIAKDYATETTLAALGAIIATPTGLPVDIQDASLAVTGPIGVTDNGGSLTVDGAVSISNFPATQPVSIAATVNADVSDRVGRLLGHVTVDNAALAITATSLPLPTGAATSGRQDTTNTLLAGGLPAALVGGRLDVNVGAIPNVTIANFPATQPVSGPLTDTQLRASAVSVAPSGVTPGNIRKTVTTAGTAVVLNSSALRIRRAIVCALTTNTGVVVVGGSGVIAALATRNSPYLNAGDSLELGPVDLNATYINSTVDGEGVTVYYEA